MPRTLRQFTEADLAAYAARDARRKELDREARALGQANQALAAELKEAFAAEGRREIRRGGFRAALQAGRASVGWKDEFIRVAGAEAAAEVLAAAPVPEHVAVAAIEAPEPAGA